MLTREAGRSCDNRAVASHRFDFDPDSPAARKLLRAARAAEPVEVEITKGLFVHDRAYGPAYGPGDRVVIAKALAERLIAEGSARRFPPSS